MWGESILDKEASAKALRQSMLGSARTQQLSQAKSSRRRGSGSPDPSGLPAAHRGDLGFASESMGTTGELSRDVP